MIESALRTRILSDTGISDLIGDRMYPLIVPQASEFPAITYQRVSSVRDYSMDGPTGLVEPRIQIDVWSDSYLTTKTLADLIRKRIDGFKGTVGAEVIQGVFMDTEREFFESGDFENVGLIRLFRVSMDFFVNYEE